MSEHAILLPAGTKGWGTLGFLLNSDNVGQCTKQFLKNYDVYSKFSYIFDSKELQYTVRKCILSMLTDTSEIQANTILLICTNQHSWIAAATSLETGRIMQVKCQVS